MRISDWSSDVCSSDLLAAAAATCRARLIHLSTDYVFDGAARSDRPGTDQPDIDHPDAERPCTNRSYTETDIARPVNVYGKSKLAGEQAVLRAQPNAIVIRTSWLYSEYGNNFVKTILRAARAGRPLRVVDDQTGSPTYAGDLADAIIRLGKGACIPGGLYHYSGDRALSWYAFARRITRLAGYENVSLTPIPSTPRSGGGTAARPAYSVLSCAKILRCGIAPASVDTEIGRAHV